VAKPDTDDGWFKMSHEFDAACDVADFTKAERVVLHTVKAQIFGPAKVRHALLLPRNIAELGGWKRQFIERGVRHLIEAGVLVPAKDRKDFYQVNKYYKEWTYSGAVRFTPAELKFIAEAPARTKSYLYTLSNQPVAKRQPTSCRIATNELPIGGSTLQPTSCQTATNELPNCNQRVAESASRSNRTARGIENIEKGEEEDDDNAGVRNATPQIPTPEVARPSVPKTLAELTEWASKAVDPLEEITRKLSVWATSYEVKWIHDAILVATSSAKPGGIVAYTNKCLMNWHANGGPPHAEVEKARASATTGPIAPPKRRGIAAELDAKHQAVRDYYAKPTGGAK
jgi:hypothetical protein